tara:strand:+ start:196 stop:390 length:195 start_codon:yes stop_codon:yes gene_type:complete
MNRFKPVYSKLIDISPDKINEYFSKIISSNVDDIDIFINNNIYFDVNVIDFKSKKKCITLCYRA